MNLRRQWLANIYLPGEPDDVIGADGELTPNQQFGIVAITALEEEWILDPQLREQLSLLTFTDEDDDQ